MSEPWQLQLYRRSLKKKATVKAMLEHLPRVEGRRCLELGCGTGQLTVPVAARVRSVVGVDPEPDMLWLARGHDEDAPNVTWVLGSDEELPAIGASLGNRPIGAITVATAADVCVRTHASSTASGSSSSVIGSSAGK